MAEFCGRIVELLQSADLSVVTAKSIRRQLESEFNTDLTERKREIDSLIVSLLPSTAVTAPSTIVAAITDTQPNTFTSQQTDAVSPSKLVSKVQPIKSTDSPAPAAVRKRTRRAAEMSSELVYDSDENEDAAEDDHAMAIRLHQDLNNSRQSSVGSRRVTRAPAGDKRLKSKTVSTDAAPKKRGNNAFNQPLLLSAAMSALFGGVHEKMSRPEVVKAIWQYIKHHSLQDPKDKRFILCDELLRPVMGGKQRVNAFGMNRYIGEHLYRPEDVVSRPVTVHAASHESNQRIQKSSVAAKEAKGKKIGSGGGFMKPLLLSPALSEVLGGEKEMARPMVVKKLWEYIKLNSLQDPADRRQILCDDRLRAVMNGRSRVSAFEMNRFLSSHLSKKEDLVSEKNDSNNDDDSDEDDDSEKNNGDDGNEQADNVKEALVPDEALLNNSDYREREHGSVDSEHELKLQQQL